ncbi:MAG: DUF116 domain-containing protein [Planctomycetes bacterium]|nr:DUF116 domain-containing protein [Planctomycetota bacterium]
MPDVVLDAPGVYRKAAAIADEIMAGSPAGDVPLDGVIAAVEEREALIAGALARRGITVVEDPVEIAYNDKGWMLRDFVWAGIWNRVSRPLFDAVPHRRRGIFLPHCITAVDGCIRENKGIHDRCARCGRCAAAGIIDAAMAKGYGEEHIYIVGGGSALGPIVERDGIKALTGVACYREARLYYSAFAHGHFKTPALMALLVRWGCRSTLSLEEAVAGAL